MRGVLNAETTCKGKTRNLTPRRKDAKNEKKECQMCICLCALATLRFTFCFEISSRLPIRHFYCAARISIACSAKAESRRKTAFPKLWIVVKRSNIMANDDCIGESIAQSLSVRGHDHTDCCRKRCYEKWKIDPIQQVTNQQVGEPWATERRSDRSNPGKPFPRRGPTPNLKTQFETDQQNCLNKTDHDEGFKLEKRTVERLQ